MSTTATSAPKTPRRSPRNKSTLAQFLDQHTSPIRSPAHKKKISQSKDGVMKVTPGEKGKKSDSQRKHKKSVTTEKQVDVPMKEPDDKESGTHPPVIQVPASDVSTKEDLEKARKYEETKNKKAERAKARSAGKKEKAKLKKATKAALLKKQQQEEEELKAEKEAKEKEELVRIAQAKAEASAKLNATATKLNNNENQQDETDTDTDNADSEDEDSNMDSEDEDNGSEVQLDDKGNPTYAEQAAKDADDATALVANDGTYKAYRARLTLVIPKPKSKEQRLKFLMEAAGKVMKAGRKLESNLYLRKFQEMKRVRTSEKKEWIQKFKSSDRSANNFVSYFAHGLYSWLPISKTEFNFRIQLVMPESTVIASFLNDYEHVLPEGCKIRGSLSQQISAPYKIGNLLRSTEKMTSSSDLLDEINRRAALINPSVVFGMSFGTIAHPNGNKKNWKKAPRAIVLETNRDIVREATKVAFQLFPAKRPKNHKSIWGMKLVFFYDTKHEECANLPSVQMNIATLINRQKVHLANELKVAHNHFIPNTIDDPVYDDDPETLRELLMSIKSKTTKGCESLNLFSSICYSEWAGTKSYWFHFHRCVKTEAESVVRALPIMLKYEYGLDPDFYFLETATDGDETWDAKTRCLENAVTLAMAAAVEGCEDLKGDDSDDDGDIEINEDDNISLKTIEEREKQRLMGGDDEETIIERSKKAKNKTKSKKKNNQKVEVIEIADNNSVGNSTIGMGSARTETRVSAQRAVLSETGNMIQQSEKKREESDAKRDAKAKELEAALQQSQAEVAELKALFLQSLSMQAPGEIPEVVGADKGVTPITPMNTHNQDDNTSNGDWNPNEGGDLDEHSEKMREDEQERKRLEEQERHTEEFMAEVDQLMGGNTHRPEMFDSNGLPTSQGLDPKYKHLSPDPEQNMNETHAPDYDGSHDDDDDCSDEVDGSSSDASSSSSDNSNSEKDYSDEVSSFGSNRDDRSSVRTEADSVSAKSDIPLSRRDESYTDDDVDEDNNRDSDLIRSMQTATTELVTKSPKPTKAAAQNALQSSRKNLDTSFRKHNKSATGGDPGGHT